MQGSENRFSRPSPTFYHLVETNVVYAQREIIWVGEAAAGCCFIA
jgi:hypothetical protein